jgi:DnaJ domain
VTLRSLSRDALSSGLLYCWRYAVFEMIMAGPDFYKILGVSPSASPDEIKSAHRELVKIFHPDLFSTSAEKARANKRLQQINEAYATLSNAGRRRQYDARLSKAAIAADGVSAATKSSSVSTSRPSSGAGVWNDLAGRVSNKLRQFKQTYRDLAEAERRGGRGAKPFQKPRSVKRNGWLRESTWARRVRGLAEIWRSWAKHLKHLVSPKVAVVIVVAVILMFVALILSAVLEEPQTLTAWGLLENTANEAAQDIPRERQWTSLGHYNTTAECAESLKKRVTMDAQGGGKVFLDDRSGTIAMTIYAKSEAALAEEYLHAKLKQTPAAADRQLLEQQAKEEAREFVRKNGIDQRVTHYQCREIQLLKPESWLRKKLRQLGLLT